MVQPGLPRFAKAVFNHHLSRGLSSSSRSSPISVARLLDSSPTDPSNVVVNGFIVSIRNHTNRSFASLGDGSSCEPLQALLTPQQGQRSVICRSPISIYYGMEANLMETVYAMAPQFD